MHCDTWLAMCHPHGSPCVIHMACHVLPDTVVLKYVKFGLSRNPTKFDWVARFRKTIPKVGTSGTCRRLETNLMVEMSFDTGKKLKYFI